MQLRRCGRRTTAVIGKCELGAVPVARWLPGRFGRITTAEHLPDAGGFERLPVLGLAGESPQCQAPRAQPAEGLG